MKEPKRLRDGDELPMAVRDALRSLGQGTAHPERVARVQHVLEELVKSAPASGAGAGAGAAGAGVSTTTLVSSALTIVVTATLVAVRYWSPVPESESVPRRATPPSLREAASGPVSPEASVEARLEERAGAKSEAREVQARTRDVQTQGEGRAHAASSREQRPRSRSAEGVQRVGSPVELPAPKAAVAVAKPPSSAPLASKAVGEDRAESAAGPPAASPPQRALPDVRKAQAPEPAPNEVLSGPSETVNGEAEQLYRAKRLATQDPSAALEALALHAARFPNGAFTQEREVLAIKLHAKLGHTDRVRALTTAFRARFPHSLYVIPR